MRTITLSNDYGDKVIGVKGESIITNIVECESRPNALIIGKTGSVDKQLIPVEGFGAEKIIGYWNENTNKFIPISNELIEELVKLHLEVDSTLPLYIIVSVRKLDGNYQTYRGFQYDSERTIYNSNNKII